ncbi:hypothetical protein BROUX41_004153 [Berkeleyomyces rouxiae]|uniref:uncharacterized protein n=1 Tax=Berkeleyomyces rouxiae TaxID=2035830 RepID=UPI003B7EC9C1
MAVTKLRISSPLEAGQSIHDACNLPPRLCDALDHASTKLSNKGINVKLAVALRDYQLPTLTIIPSANSQVGVYASQPPTPGSPSASAPTCSSSASSRFGFSNAISGLRQRLAGHVPSTLPLITSWGVGSPAASPASSSAYTPMTPMSPPPMSACTSTTFTSATDVVSPHGPCTLGIRLIQTTKLDAKTSRTMHHVLNKTRVKFGIGYDMLPQITAPDACGLTDTIIRRSINQDEILYGSKGLTLISLDRFYTFKSALSSYSRTGSPSRLEDAVDELRRLYLANGSRKVCRSYINRSYDWLSVGDQAFADVDIMYRRAYGGVEGHGAIEGLSAVPSVAKSDSSFESLSGNVASFPHRFARARPSSVVASFPLDEKVHHGHMLPTESESTSEISLPSWDDQADVFHLVNDRSYTPPSLKRASTPRTIDYLHRDSTPRATVTTNDLSSFATAKSVPVVTASIAAVAAPLPQTVPVRPASATPPPAPTCERPPATILSRTPPPRSLTRSLPKLVIPTSSPSLVAKHVASQPQLRLQTSFPVLSTTVATTTGPSGGYRQMATIGEATGSMNPHIEIIETPCTARPSNSTQLISSFSLPFPVPPPPAPDAFPDTTATSPTSAVATNFYRLRQPQPPPPQQQQQDPADAKASLGWHPNASIAQLLSPFDPRVSMQSYCATPAGPRLGPLTPNGADDISPITRGEWGFLFAGSALLNTRTVAVETCHGSAMC